MNKIILNRIQCLLCKDVITSYHRHDFKYCVCGNCAIDGGNDYLKRSCNAINTYKDLSIYSDAPFEIIRESLHRGGRGKDGNQPLKWVKLSEMSNEWLENAIDYNKSLGYLNNYVTRYYIQELNYRRENNIQINDN